MAASILPRFLRNQSQSAQKIILLFNKQILYEPPPPPPMQTSPVLAHLLESEKRPSQDSFSGEINNSSLSSIPSQFCPSFSVGLFLSPISSTGLTEEDVAGDVSSDSRTIWADSVKKKRKRKMNKHKLRKLRRRLRKKT